MLRTGLSDLGTLLSRRTAVQVGHLIGHHHSPREKGESARDAIKARDCRRRAGSAGGES